MLWEHEVAGSNPVIPTTYINVNHGLGIGDWINRLSEIEYKIEIDSKAISFLAKKGYNKEYGARPVKRAIQKFIEDEIAKMIVKNKIKKNDNIVISHKKDNDKLDFSVST